MRGKRGGEKGTRPGNPEGVCCLGAWRDAQPKMAVDGSLGSDPMEAGMSGHILKVPGKH